MLLAYNGCAPASADEGGARAPLIAWEVPLEGAHVMGEVGLCVAANETVSDVTFFLYVMDDWALIGPGTEEPDHRWQAQWDTEEVPDGTYRLMANGTLDGGGTAAATVENVTVDNTPPSPVFLSPPSSTRLRGQVPINVTADEPLSSVDIFLNTGTGPFLLGPCGRVTGTENWTYTWDTTAYSERVDLTLIASAKDLAGNENMGAFLVGIDIDNVPPQLELLAPTDNESISGLYALSATCDDPNMRTIAFEWRIGTGTWLPIATFVANHSLDTYACVWDLYELTEYDGIQVRVVAVDDLGQLGSDLATGVDIVDIPPQPRIIAPLPGSHVTGTVTIEVGSQPDTRGVELSYSRDAGATNWTAIGQATQGVDGAWRCDWATSSLTAAGLTIRAVATDGSGGSGESTVADVEVDNTAPAPWILRPAPGEYRIPHDYVLEANSDRDTVRLFFSYKVAGDWVFIGNASYDVDHDRWRYAWSIDSPVNDSAILATAMDEVGLAGTAEVADIDLDPGDRAPAFLTTMVARVEMQEDSAYEELDLAPHVDDDRRADLMFYVTGEDPLLVYVAGENQTGELVMTFIPVANAHGEVLLRLYVVDKANQRAQTDLLVVVSSRPDPPYFVSVPPNVYVHPAKPYSFNYSSYIEDVDTPRSGLRIEVPVSARPYVSVNTSNPLGLVFSFTDRQLGQVIAFKLVVLDESDNQVSRDISITVTSDLVPELREPLPDIEMLEDVSNTSVFELDEFFFDPDRDTLYYSYGNTHVTVVISDKFPHTVGIFLPPDWYGDDTITFRATDPKGALLEDTVRVRVRPVDDPPMFLDNPAIPEIRVRVGTDYYYELKPYIVDVDDAIGSLELTTDDPAHAQSYKYAPYVLGLKLSYPAPERSIRLRISVSDGVATVMRNITVTIISGYVPELIGWRPPSDIVLEEGGTYPQAFDMSVAFDQDLVGTAEGLRSLKFEFLCYDSRQSEPFGQAEYVWRSGAWVDLYADRDVGLVRFRMTAMMSVDIALADPDWHTQLEGYDWPLIVIIRVKDQGNAFSEYSLLLHVMPVNDAPSVSPIPAVNVTGVFGLVLRTYVRDVDTPYSALTIRVESLAAGVIANAQVYGELLYLDFTDSDPRTEVLKLTVSDGEYTVSTNITVNVRAMPAEGLDLTMWLWFIVVIAASGGAALYLSKFIWRRFEPPNVQDVFLVYGDGVIIRHLTRRGVIGMDEDLAIAMLTAIQEFVQQSMRSAQLKSMQAGEHNILIERDRKRNFYIAVIHTGSVSDELRIAVNLATRAVQDRYARVLARWNGDLAKFDGVDELLRDILKISSARIPEGVRFEMEGITSIEPGKTFLLQGQDVMRTHNIFRALVEEHGHGLLISRVHPERLHDSIAKAGAECIWLSKTPTKRGVSPSNTTMILSEIATYARDHPGTVVCLDGLEYLTVHSPVDEVVKFLNELTDMVQVDGFVMMVHVDPGALDQAMLARLSRDMVRVSESR